MVDKARAGGSGASGEARQTWGLLQSGRLGSVALPPFSSGPHLTPPFRPQLIVANLNTEPSPPRPPFSFEAIVAHLNEYGARNLRGNGQAGEVHRCGGGGQLEAFGAKIEFAKQVGGGEGCGGAARGIMW